MQMKQKTRSMTSVLALMLSMVSMVSMEAGAHATVTPKQATQESYQRLAFGITHGCEGSATIEVVIDVPEALMGAKPMPKPGWTISTETKPLATPYVSHGRTVTEEVRQIRWKGGPLPDAWFDEFVIQARLGSRSGALPIPVTQICENGSIAWRELTDESGRKPKSPAPVLQVLPADKAHAHH